MYRFVCTKHLKDLTPSPRGLNADTQLVTAMALDIDPDDTFPPTLTYAFDLTQFDCPANHMTEELAKAVQGLPAEYQKGLEDANCTSYHCVIDADSGYPLEDFFELDAVHINWYGSTASALTTGEDD